MPAAPSAYGRFIGRTVELATLERALMRARAGNGGVFLLTGEAGIGKTRFCREVAVMARKAGMAVAWGGRGPDGSVPLWPWPAIFADLGAEISEPSHDRPAHLNTTARRLTELCFRRPSLLVFDDASSVGVDARLLLRFVAGSAERLLLLMLLTGREPLVELTTAALVPLQRFSLAETTEFLRSYTDAVSDLESLAAAAHRLSSS